MDELWKDKLTKTADASYSIQDKAFFNNHCITELCIPDEVTHIGNWCFAHAVNLQRLLVPRRSIVIGRKAFLDCPNLASIVIYESKRDGDSDVPDTDLGAAKDIEITSVLLANLYRDFPEKMIGKAFELAKDFAIAGDGNRVGEWLEYYDEALLQFVNRADDADYEPVFIGWFDVEDFDDQQLAYQQQIRITKQRLLLQRLIYEKQENWREKGYVKEKNKSFFMNKLMEKKIIEVTESALTLKGRGLLSQGSELLAKWLPEDRELGSNIFSYEIWYETGLLDRNGIDELLRNDSLEPEIRAYLISLSGEKKEAKFDAFAL